MIRKKEKENNHDNNNDSKDNDITIIIVSNHSFPGRGVPDFKIENKRKKIVVDHYSGDTKEGKRRQ